MKHTNKILGGIALIASLGIATAVHAYGGGYGPDAGSCMGNGPAMGQAHGPMGGMAGPHGMHGRMADRASFDPAAMMEGRLAYLKSALKITDKQDSAWQAFSAKARQQGESMQARRASMPAQDTTLSAPERMALRTAVMKQRLDSMDAMAHALKDLYAVLTPEQKAVADQNFGNRLMAFAGRHR